jgi:transcriptional regulator with XRE-family HTH domain
MPFDRKLIAKRPTLRYEPDRALRLLIRQMVEARFRAGLTQEAIAERLNTTRSAISRLESGKFNRPTLATLEHYAMVTGCRLEIRFRRVYGPDAFDDGVT